MSLTGNGAFGPNGPIGYIKGPRIIASQHHPAITGEWKGLFLCISDIAIQNPQDCDIWVDTSSNSIWQWAAELGRFTTLEPIPAMSAYIAGLKLSTPGYYKGETAPDPAPLPEVCSTEE